MYYIILICYYIARGILLYFEIGCGVVVLTSVVEGTETIDVTTFQRNISLAAFLDGGVEL